MSSIDQMEHNLTNVKCTVDTVLQDFDNLRKLIKNQQKALLEKDQIINKYANEVEKLTQSNEESKHQKLKLIKRQKQLEEEIKMLKKGKEMAANKCQGNENDLYTTWV